MLFHIIASTACITLFGIMPGHAQTREAVHPLTAEQERALKPTDSFKECDKCPEMVVVPAGSFTMGSPASEVGRYDDEGPQHLVTFAKPFAVGRFAVTFDEWDACVADGGCNGYRPADEGWGRGRRPVINVSWDDAEAYLSWLARKTGKTYRLPSEAEREYVTRAGTTTAYWWGSSISTSQANYDGTRTVSVDSFEPNPWGLYQVHGNVWEWMEDCYQDYNGAPIDGSARTSGNCNPFGIDGFGSGRVVRGGSWIYGARGLRSAVRGWVFTDSRGSYEGFRVGRTLNP
jgi:formylglycine-generating enzyme required for sulfatase activity